MKPFLFLAILSFSGFLSTLQAQFSMIGSVGISPQQTPVSHAIFINRSTRNEFTFDLRTVKASYYIGAGTRYNVLPFFFQAEAQYNKREYIYDVTYTYAGRGRTEQAIQYAEQMNVINLPLTLGVDLGLVEVTSGFLPQLILSHQSDLADISGYQQHIRLMRFGWQTGVAAKINQMRIGLNWQMDFDNYADHTYIQDQSLALHGLPSRLVGSMSYVF